MAMKTLNIKSVLSLIALPGLLAGIIGGFLVSVLFLDYRLSHLDMEDGPSVVNFDNISYVTAWQEASPAVVSVVALKDLSDYYNPYSIFGFSAPQPQTEEGELSEVSSGTAFLVTPDGLAVTNRHVVADEEAEYVVVLQDGTELDAEVLARDSLNDIALIQLSGDDERIGDLPTLEFADSDQLSVGESVLAIGNALGEFSNTATAGVISAKDRQIVASSGYGSAENLVNLLQTDAAINSGNSGGPLVNLAGDLVGMNTAVSAAAEGIGFAIPANDIAAVVASYQEFGRIVRPFLGVRYMMVGPGLQERFDLEYDYGALLASDPQYGPAILEGGSAEKAGLRVEDVILSLNGKDLNGNFTLQNAIAGYFVGETVLLEVWREGEIIEVELELEERPEE